MLSWLYYIFGYADKTISSEAQTKMLYENKFVFLPRDKDEDLFNGPFRYC